MTVEQAIGIIERMSTGVKVAFQHRFAGDKGTILRLDNYAMINIFDDGRYYIQGNNTDELVIAFALVQEAWDPDAWVKQAHEALVGQSQPELAPRPAGPDLGRRFEF
jgi:hypothetical protein